MEARYSDPTAAAAHAELDARVVALEASTGGGVISIPVPDMSAISDGDILTNFTPGYAGTIVKVAFAITTPVTTAAKLSSLHVEIGATATTGGVVALTSANCTPLGAVIAGSAITANNTFTASSTLSVVAASTTAFVEGAGVILISVS